MQRFNQRFYVHSVYQSNQCEFHAKALRNIFRRIYVSVLVFVLGL